MITVDTLARYRQLTTLAAVKAELSLTTTTDDAWLTTKIMQATDAIRKHCGRIFERQHYIETCGGFGDIDLVLSHRPVLVLDEILYQGGAVDDVTLDDPDAGILVRLGEFLWTANQTFKMAEYPLPGQERPDYQITYWAGYITPDADQAKANDVSVAALDQSFNSAAGVFPTSVLAGDIIQASGFTNGVNNGRFTVVTATANKITVKEGGLVDEAAGAGIVACRTLPMDVELAAIETVKSWYFDRTRDRSIVQERVGDLLQVFGADQPADLDLPLPIQAMKRLSPYRSVVR